MRISDWSSDVCSSDLKVNTYYTYGVDQLGQAITMAARKMSKRRVLFLGSSKSGYGALFCGRSSQLERSSSLVFSPVTQVYPLEKPLSFKTFPWFMDLVAKRSKEHTSELQSLMRISYAVFCVKKKNHQHSQHSYIHIQTYIS